MSIINEDYFDNQDVFDKNDEMNEMEPNYSYSIVIYWTVTTIEKFISATRFRQISSFMKRITKRIDKLFSDCRYIDVFSIGEPYYDSEKRSTKDLTYGKRFETDDVPIWSITVNYNCSLFPSINELHNFISNILKYSEKLPNSSVYLRTTGVRLLTDDRELAYITKNSDYNKLLISTGLSEMLRNHRKF